MKIIGTEPRQISDAGLPKGPNRLLKELVRSGGLEGLRIGPFRILRQPDYLRKPQAIIPGSGKGHIMWE